MPAAKKLADYRDSSDPVLSFAAIRASGEKATAAQRGKALDDPRVAALMERACAWPWECIASHKSAQQPFHALSLLAELGFSLSDGALRGLADRLLASMGEDGLPRIPTRTSEAHGGDGKEIGAWALCDAPTLMYSLARLGAPSRSLAKGTKTIAGLAFASGWPCAVSPELGAWRGPGKKSDPCPYASLVALKLLLENADAWAKEIEAGKECLLGLWERSRTDHPYIFYMGTDFRKPKLPWIWYDIVHVAEVLSRCPGIGKDKRFRAMLGVLESAAGPEGFVPSTVYLAFKDWDFGQKKAPSEWLGFARARIEARL